jgi:hypothetical protein
MARSDYHARRAARIERLNKRAEKARQESSAAEAQARRMADVIPCGQPVLCGHYSEKRDRRYRDRIHNTFQRSWKASKQAETLERRAAVAESNRAVSSDDPDAPDLLRERIAKLEAEQDLSKRINAAIRRAKGDLAAARANLEALGLKPGTVDSALAPNHFGELGVPGYHLRNTGAEIRRLRARLDSLAATERREQASTQECYGAIMLDQEDNRVALRFPGKPSEAVRSELKSHGFRWSPTSGAWQRQASESALYWGRTIARKTAEASQAEAPPNEAP